MILVFDGWGILCDIAFKLMSLDLTDDKSALFQVIVWCHQHEAITWANVDSVLWWHAMTEKNIFKWATLRDPCLVLSMSILYYDLVTRIQNIMLNSITMMS